MSDILKRVQEHPTLSPEAKREFVAGWRRGELDKLDAIRKEQRELATTIEREEMRKVCPYFKSPK